MKKSPIADLKHLVTKLDNYFIQLAKEHDVEHLAGPQGYVIVYLKRHADQDVAIKDVEHGLDISKSVASNLIKRMKKNGFITTEISSRDKRTKLIRLTVSGEAKAEKLIAFFDIIKKDLFIGIAEEDLDIVKKVIAQMQKNLRKEKRG